MLPWGSGAKNYRVKDLFLALAPFFARVKTPKIPFIGLSLFSNPKETLATQARIVMTMGKRPNPFFWRDEFLRRRPDLTCRLLNS